MRSVRSVGLLLSKSPCPKFSFIHPRIRGVGLSFAGSKGLSQGLLVTLAIAMHNIPEGLAENMVLASQGVSPHDVML